MHLYSDMATSCLFFVRLMSTLRKCGVCVRGSWQKGANFQHVSSTLPLERLRLIAPLVFLLVWLLMPIKTMATPLTLSIDQVRQQPNGTEVVIIGIVTVPSGQFASATFDQGFAIQDQSSGIYVSSDRPLNLTVGDGVRVEGILQDDGRGQPIVHLQNWQHSKVLLPSIRPYRVSLKEAVIELDGQLVVVQGTITRPLVEDAPYGDRLWIKDATGTVQIYIPRSTRIAPQDLTFLQPGQAVQVTGFSSQYDRNDEIVPRTVEDIRPLEAVR